MLHRIKPVPRAILILAVVGGLGYAAMQIDLSAKLPKQEAETTTVVVPQTAPQTAPQPAPAQPTEQNTEEAPSTLVAIPVPNAGLDAVLNAGKK